MSFQQAQKYLDSFINYEKLDSFPSGRSFKLERTQSFLKTLDNPQDHLRVILVAGTKGKGSTCAFVSNILREAGFRVGLYTSPHLSSFRERIRILEPNNNSRSDFEGMISEEDIDKYVQRFKPLIKDFYKHSKWGPLSFFEVYTSLALLYFKEKRVDFAVLEAGLGGRLDATNVSSPLACAITSISYEHTKTLGSTLREIAQEKSGIIKDSSQVVISAAQNKEVESVIEKRCQEYKAKLYRVGKEIVFEETGRSHFEGLFNLMGMFSEYPHLRIRLLGEHQLMNASVAVGLVEAMRFWGAYVSLDAIRRGLETAFWPARFEIVSKTPWTVLDGAQNVASAVALKQTINRLFKPKRLILVLGISKDKDIKGICKELEPIADEIILTAANNPRAAKVKYIKEFIPKTKKAHLTKSVKEAIGLAKSIAAKDDLILITGSLFVVGEARELWLK